MAFRQAVKTTIAALFFLGATVLPMRAERPLPHKLTAAILVKLIEFEKRAESDKSLSIHVVGDSILAGVLREMIGAKSGRRVLGTVTEGDALPESQVDVVLVAKSDNLESILDQARARGIMSASNSRRLAEDGISISIFDDEGMPGVMLNRSASKQEGLTWQPEILEIARVLP